MQELEYRTSANVEAVYLPVADPAPEALASVTAELDAVIALSRRLASDGLYPAIDPATSTSILLDPNVVGAERVETAARVRERLVDTDDATARLLRAYLTQPFHVAEEFTGRGGEEVSPDEAARDARALLAGDRAVLTPDDLYMTDSLAEARGGA